MGFTDWRLRRKNRIALDWIQIEVSSLCNASCFYCPHTIYREQWHAGAMPLNTFQRLVAEFPKTKLLFLQGWGEPFTNKNLFDMIAIGKKAGCRVGLTTNGMALDSESIDRLVDLDLDILGISLAGTTPASHNQRRAGTDFDQITASLLALKEKKAIKKSPWPQVHLAYIMLKSNFEDLRSIIPYAKYVAAENIVCSNLTFFPTLELEEEAILGEPSKSTYYEETLKGLQARAKRENINFHFYGCALGEKRPICPENVLKSCYISHDGFVSSCVFTNIPVSEGFKPGAGQRKVMPLPKRVLYGNISQQSLSEIWHSDSYKGFREVFMTRQARIKDRIDLFVDATQFPLHTKASVEIHEDLIESLPEHCMNCHKMYGT